MLIIKNRKEAGKLLAEELKQYQGENALVLAIPRGGVVLGYEIAKELSLPLDIIIVRKIGHPAYPEYAIGAVDSKGNTTLNEREVETIDHSWLKMKIEEEKNEALRRLSKYRKGHDPISINDKVIILVDDGIATGFTIRLALKIIREQHPKEIVIAVSVAPKDIISLLHEEGAVRIVTLIPPSEFMGGIGSHYLEFNQVNDEEVMRLLEKQRGLKN